MENTLFTPEMKEVLTERRDEVMALMALSLLTDTKKSPLEIMQNHLYSNLQASSTWEQIKEHDLDLAKQVLEMFPEKYHETNAFIQEITPLEDEELVKYLQEKCGYFLFSHLNVAFSLSKEVVEEYQIKQIA